MAFNHLPAAMHDALGPLSVTPVTHSVPMAKNHRPSRPPENAGSRPSPTVVLDRLAAAAGRAARITHTEHLPPRAGTHALWPDRIRPEVISAIGRAGIDHPWTHQATAAEHALDGESVVIATGTASGKSLAYLAPVLSTLLEGSHAPNGRGTTALYLAPTKALAADQRRAVKALAAPLGSAIRPAVYDGDTPVEEREWVRQYANYVLTNPDMLHRGILPSHPRWASFLRSLRFVVIDECHTYRGVFGSHVAQVLRRLRRLCARYGSDPVFLLASATAAQPSVAAGRLTGLPVKEVADDASPRGEMVFALWEPPLTELHGEKGAPVRRTATAETADLLTDLTLQGVRSVAFVRSRRGAELISLIAKERLAEVDGSLPGRVAAYRGGYLPEERRALERALHSGDLLGLAATTALELGIDVSGLDAVVIAGYPGTRASLWQQAGRAGRSGQGALAVLVARDDPLDTFLVHHPEALFQQPVESTVLDPDNPYVLAPHLCAAAAELPLTEADIELFGPAVPELLPQLEAAKLLRRRTTGWHWTRRERAADLTDIRGGGGRPVQIVEEGTGRLLGTVDESAAHTAVHEGAVHLHQGRTYLVRTLDLEDSVALVEEAVPPYSTNARDTTAIAVLETDTEIPWGDGRLCFGSVEVTNQVVSFLRRRLITGEVLGETKLDLPPRTLRTRAVWWTVTEDQLDAARITPEILGGALHAAEHASIGMLPLFATCDRWDIGGVSVPLHPDTLLPTVFVYDGHPGGAGFAERAFHTARTWLTATRQAIASCECEAGCPSCIQSPKCGNGNEPLHKRGAVRLLTELLRTAPPDPPSEP
ncbi:DEAD/DEAH box helicase [Streptomyces sp. NE06-03E]|uniref:DEAD/DEAH box helicase n=2 Tax=Streptomyces TaxID=1883 RepID=A0A652KUK2_9ACTN|nr:MULTISPECIES: DEAD/DEAH box helicase [unclassified Streptomyces]WSS62733.1 DEAD/DEAH box helicase [Streptomyces sp. NBC_01177]MDX3057434.1 DEAD/DEAH box helicase [Streptomyces sp. NE06-03E]MDX3326836.1 DEAD/DEAH box helicase [Streptomyces sp. ME02-6979-3A]MDX3429531.1 DEAD/DEAH box helicase [Streptomyces sp. ME01-18a]MDX3686931.1 DEAD/DEAH box helicase [Streptomyces sp. AK04-4c]